MIKTFSEILDEQIEKTLSENTEWNHAASSFHSMEDPDLSELIYQGFRIQPQSIRRSYPRKKIIPTAQPMEPMTTASEPENFYLLSKIQTDALIHINRALNPKDQLQGRWTALQIRKAFRSAAKIYHPDHGGNTALFMELQQSAKILLDFLLSIK